LETGRKLNGHSCRFCLAIIFFLALVPNAQAETVAQTVRKWGLLGPWSLDCSLKPDRNKGTVLAYEIASGDRVIHRRDFGDMTDESEVVAAEISADGILNLRVFFPSLRQTREYGFRMQPDGTIRAMYNRNQKNEYTIKDGKFIANGNPTPPQHKCNRESSGRVDWRPVKARRRPINRPMPTPLSTAAFADTPAARDRMRLNYARCC
jgi:hypothetical protein